MNVYVHAGLRSKFVNEQQNKLAGFMHRGERAAYGEKRGQWLRIDGEEGEVMSGVL